MKHTKDTSASVRVLDGPLEFWNVKPTELGIIFFLSVLGAEWIRVFKLLANRMALFWKIGDALVIYNWGDHFRVPTGRS
jgi:hypothetical protein